MMSFSRRILAGILAVLVLPLAALALGNEASAPANKTAAAASSSAPEPAATPAPPTLNPAVDPLLQLLVSKGVLSATEVNGLASAPANQMREQLLLLLKAKGVLTAEDLNALKVPASATSAVAVSASSSAASAVASTEPNPADPQGGGGPTVIPAVAPIRVLQTDPPKREGFIPDVSIGKNIRLKPYGFFKTSVVYDTASPYGNDFPLPGFIGDINTVDKMPEFHLKARALRLGTNFEWLDIVPKVAITAKLEFDFEGNFSRANNRNISSIRSSMPSIRLGYGRIDYHATDNTTVHLLAGQDWTPFASSTLPNLFETTGFGIGFGTLYERAPQVRFGLNHNFGGDRKFQLEPEFAVVLPAYGNLPANVADQLGFGERQGADSARPEIQARLVAQFQLDQAPAVAPAQIIVSGVQGDRSVVALASAIPVAFKAAFPTGIRTDSSRHGWTAEAQLPTRWFTLIGKYYNGSDLRFYFAGQILAEFNDTTGLTGTATAPSIDGASTLVLGLRGGVPVVANQLPPRSQGGFINLGLPLSRWANANPSGRNAGWVMYLHYGYDQVLARDVRRLGGGRMKGDVLAPSLQYKMNNFISFVVEESLYRTRAIPLTSTGNFPLFQGRPMREINDFRSEIGTVFSF
ncbi:MAG TPA: hypothetical protein VJA94_06850 [Candidatus Angelobacter sp.]